MREPTPPKDDPRWDMVLDALPRRKKYALVRLVAGHLRAESQARQDALDRTERAVKRLSLEREEE